MGIELDLEQKEAVAVPSAVAEMSDQVSEVNDIREETNRLTDYRERLADKKFEAKIDSLALSDADKTKLVDMMGAERYSGARMGAKVLDPKCRLPAKRRIVDALLDLPEEKYRAICELTAKPTLLIVPGSDFMKMSSIYDEVQRRLLWAVYSGEEKRCPFVIGKPAKVMADGRPRVPAERKTLVSIADGATMPRMSNVSDDKYNPGSIKDELTRQFDEKGMRHIHINELMALYVQSLVEAHRKGDRNLVVDNWNGYHKEKWDGKSCSRTIINPEDYPYYKQVFTGHIDTGFYGCTMFEGFDPKRWGWPTAGHCGGRATFRII